jgi:hypothetical protein
METLDHRCNRCGAEGRPSNPEEPNALRWKLSPGWILVQSRQGGWGRNCPRCADVARQRHLAYLRSPARMPLILDVLLQFWKQYPTRRLGEVIALAARMRRSELAQLDDLDLASALRAFTLEEPDRAFERAHGLEPIDPWSLFPAPDDEPAALDDTTTDLSRAA